MLHYLRTCFCTRQHTLQYTKNGCVVNFFATKTAIQATIFFDTNDNRFCNNVKKLKQKKKKPKRKVYRVALLHKLVFAKYSTLYNNTQKNSTAVRQILLLQFTSNVRKNDTFFCRVNFLPNKIRVGRHRKAFLKNAVVCKFQT